MKRALAQIAQIARALPLCGLACEGLSPEPEPQPEAPLLAAVPSERALERVRLLALEATSGAGVDRIADADRATSWTPVPDPSEEGVWLEFVATIGGITVEGCPIPGAEVELFADGSSLGQRALDSGPASFEISPPGEVHSLYLRMLGPVGACLSEVSLRGAGGERLSLQPPRRVRGAIRATSVLSPEAAYRPAYLFDARPHFAWIEGERGDGEGQRIDITFEEPQRVTAIEIWNGYQRSKDHFQKNSRLAKIRASGATGSPVDLDVADQEGPQLLVLDPPVEGSLLRIEILESVDGNRYDDLAISEIRLHDAEGPFALQTTDLERAEAALREELGASPLGRIVGRTLQSRCSPALGTLKLRRDSSFVWYGARAEGAVGSSEVFDGAWAIERKDAPWASVSLFGRRHQVPQGWQPGIDPKSIDSTALSSGDLEIALAVDLGPKVASELKSLGKSSEEERVACAIEAEIRELALDGSVLVKGDALTDLLVPAP